MELEKLIISRLNLALLAGAACLLPAVALAQADGATASGAASTVDEIVVTAQRRSERYVDVPASVSVVTAKQLSNSGVTGSRELRLLTPGLNITQQGLYTQPTIRGVGTTVTGPGADPNVAIYVDGVYQGNQGASLFEFNNLEQIETLKGPQGSLYGRNATGGAIVITTRAPSLDKVSGSAEVSYGRFDEWRLSGYVNVPLGDKVAVNLAAFNRINDGYTRNVTLNEKSSFTKSSGARARVLVQPTDDVRIILTGTRVTQSDNTAFSYGPLNNNTPQVGTQAALFGLTDHRRIALNSRPTSKTDITALTLNAEWTGDWGTLTSVSSWADTSTPFYTDLDGTERNVQSFKSDPQSDTTKTQEITYASPDYGRFSWIGGVYYYYDKASSVVQISVGGVPLPFPPLRPFATQITHAYAGYAEGTFDVTDQLHLTLGGRYSWEEKHATNRDGVGGVLMLDATQSWDAFTPHAAIRYDITDQSSAYASYSQGFKSGLFDAGATGTCTTITNPTCPFAGVPVEPEKVRAYEVGYKYNVGGTVISAAAFFNQYKNIQINALNAVNQQVLYNAAAAEIYGVDAEFTWRPTDNFTLHSGAAYTHSEYTNFPLGQNFRPLPAGGNLQVTANDAGNELIRSPKFTAFASASYTHELPAGSLESTLTVSHSGSYFWHVDNRLKQPSFTMVNAHVSWISPSERWKVTVFGDNLANEETMLYVREAVVGDLVSYGKPRSYGVGIGVNF